MDAALVAGESSVCAHDAVAGDDDRDGVAAHGSAYGLRGHLGLVCLRCDFLGNVAVCGGRAVWDSLEDVPDCKLERCAVELHWWHERRFFACEVDVKPVACLQ